MRRTTAERGRRVRAAGMEVTPQRAAIYRAIGEITSHPTAETLYRSVRRIHPTVALLVGQEEVRGEFEGEDQRSPFREVPTVTPLDCGS